MTQGPDARPRWEARAADLGGAAGLLVVFVGLSLRRIGDFDLPWHLATGRLMVEQRALPRIDALAYTARPVQHTEVVSDLLLYAAHALGGPVALQALGALIAVSIALALWAQTRRFGPFAWFAIALALGTMNPWLLVRPATLSFLLLATSLWLLDRHRRAPATRSGERALAWLAPLFFVWGNTHGGVLIGLCVVWLYAGHRLACAALHRGLGGRWQALSGLLPAEDAAHAATTALAAAVATLVAMLNTAGPKLLYLPFIASRDFATTTEWQRPTPAFFVGEPIGAVLAVVTLLALLFGREPDRRRAPPLFSIGLWLLGVAMGASAVRLIAFAAVLMAPTLARRLSAHVVRGAIAAASSAPIVLLGCFLFVRPYTSVGVGFEPRHFPEGAVRFVEAHELRGHMHNFLPFGGYLAWRLYPRHRVLVDGRTGWVHDPALVARVHQSELDAEAFASLVKEQDLQWAVTRSAEGEAFGVPLAQSDEWALVFFDDAGSVYVRRDGVNGALAREGYRVFRHLMPPDFMLAMAMEGRRADDLAHDGRLAAQQAPTSPRAIFLQATGALAVRDGDTFVTAVGRLDDLSPGHPAVALLRRAWNARGR